MRITNGMMSMTYMSDLQNNLQRLYTAQMQQSSGKRIQRLSDDPVGLIQGLNARQQISRIEQFQRNITDARRWQDASENSMREMSALIQDAYELTVQAGSDTVPDEVRASSIAPKARALLEQLINTANATSSDEYTFGAFNLKNQVPVTRATADDVLAASNAAAAAGFPTAPGADPVVLGPNGTPLTNEDGTSVVMKEGDILYNGVPMSAYYNRDNLETLVENNTLEFQIGFNLPIAVTMTAPEAMVFSTTDKDGKLVMQDMIKTLENFCEALERPCSAEEAQDFIRQFQDAQTHVDSCVSEMGGRWNRVDMMEDRYSKDELMYTTVKSTLEDVDIAEAIMNFSMTSAVYNASLQLGPRVIQPTLMDYLR